MSDIYAPNQLEAPRERPKPRRRINLAAIVIGLLIALTPEPSNAIVVGLLAGAVLFTVRWVWYRWTNLRDIDS